MGKKNLLKFKCDKTQKLKLWQNPKDPVLETKLLNPNRDKTQKLKLGQISKTPFVTKLKTQFWQNLTKTVTNHYNFNDITKESIYDTTQKPKLGQFSKLKMWQNKTN